MITRQHRIGWAVATIVLAAAGTQIITAAPAAAVPGLRFPPVLGPFSADNATTPKSASATCPSTAPRIVGGGIVINDHGQRRAFAQVLLPVKNLNPSLPDQFSVSATTPPGFVGTFAVRAVAVCASNAGVPGHIVIGGPVTPPSTDAAENTTASCSATGKKVIGFGGIIYSGGRNVGLQTVRSAGPRDISRAYAQKNGTYSTPWRVQAFAICITTSDTTPPTGAAVPGNVASTLCSNSPNRFVHGPGGGAWDGIGLIHQILPSDNLKQTTVIITPGSTAAFTSAICQV